MAYLLILLWNLAALVPIWLGLWSVFAVLGFYWFENVCTGVGQYAKLRDAERESKQRDGFIDSTFFALHYGIFTGVHGILVAVFFGLVLTDARVGGASGWWLSALAVALMHFVSYRREWVAHQGWKHTTPVRLMFEPYARVLVLHLVVILGGYLALSSETPRQILLLFAALKLLIELAATALWMRCSQIPGRVALSPPGKR